MAAVMASTAFLRLSDHKLNSSKTNPLNYRGGSRYRLRYTGSWGLLCWYSLGLRHSCHWDRHIFSRLGLEWGWCQRNGACFCWQVPDD